MYPYLKSFRISLKFFKVFFFFFLYIFLRFEKREAWKYIYSLSLFFFFQSLKSLNRKIDFQIVGRSVVKEIVDPRVYILWCSVGNRFRVARE